MNKIKNGWLPLEEATSTDHLDLNKSLPAPPLPHLRPSTAVMNLRVPLWLLNSLKQEANRRDVPYQSLVKLLLSEKLAELAQIQKQG